MRFISVDGQGDLKAGLDQLNWSGPIALDCETDGVEDRTCKLQRIILSDKDTACSIEPSIQFQIPRQLLVLQNFKYDFKVLHRHGHDLFSHPFRDTMLLHHLLDETSEHGLDFLVQHYFGDNYKQQFWAKYQNYTDAPREAQLEYECKDAIYTARLFANFMGVLGDRSNLVEQVHELARHLALTELKGVHVDVPHIMQKAVEIDKQISEIQVQLRPCVEEYCINWETRKWFEEIEKRKTSKGKEGVPRPVFNFGSGTQVQWLLYDKAAIALPVVSKTKAGKPSTDYDALLALSGKHPVVDLLRDYKGTQTLYTTFVEGILKRQVDGVIYPEFNVNGTVTGRISSSNPNLQNMPKEGPYRGFFVPTEGMVFFGADYSQLEVVVEANLSGDRQLRKIILEGASKHDITNDELKLGNRNLAKTLNFAMQYWCSVYKVQELLGVSNKEAEYIYNRYWEVYQGVKALKAFTDKRVDDGLSIINPFGRERHFPETFTDKREEARAKRQAYNALIQGTGADLTHRSFGRIAAHTTHGRMLFPVHDEILGECTPETVEGCKQELCNTMQGASTDLDWDLPLKAVAYGPLQRWSKA